MWHMLCGKQPGIALWLRDWYRLGPHAFSYSYGNVRDLSQLTWEMRIESEHPKLPATQDLPDFSYHRYADLLGLKGVHVDRPEDVGHAWDEAPAADRPMVFEVYTSRDVPTLLPHMRCEEAKEYISALLKSDPQEVAIIKTAAEG